MKKMLIFSLLILGALPLVSNAQTFSLPELVTLVNKNIDNFDTYVVGRGFIYQETIQEENAEGVTYALNQDQYSTKAAKFITLYTKYISDNRRNVTYQTLLSTDYLKIKNQAKLNGFKFVKTDNYKGTTILVYQKGQMDLSFSLIHSEDEGVFTTTYLISINKNTD